MQAISLHIFRKTIMFCLLISIEVPIFSAPLRIVKVGAFNYYPAIFKDTDGQIKGFYVDALHEIEKFENIKFEYIYVTWQEGLEKVKNGQIDLMPSVAYTPERALFLDYAKIPLLTVWGELYVSHVSKIEGLMDIEGKKVAIMKGDFNAKYFMELIKKFNITAYFIEYNDFDEVFKAIELNETDAGIVNNTFGAAKFNLYKIGSSGVVFNPFDIYFATQKGRNADLLKLLDNYFDSWKHKENSVYNKARIKWSHGNVGLVEILPNWILYTIYIFVGLILVFAIFIFFLKKQVYKATKNILQQKEVLKISENKFRSYIDYSPIGIFVVDKDGNYLEVNKAATEITGYTAEELTKMNITDLHSLDTREKSLENFLTLKETGRISSEFQFVHKNGNKRWWAIEGIKISDNQYLGYARDITERKESDLLLQEKNVEIENQNKELVLAKNKAEESDRLKTSFLQNLSHEIRTPLNAIMGFAELIPNNLNSKEKTERFCNIIRQRGEDLIVIINDILDIAKINAGQLPVNLSNCNMGELLNEIETFFTEYQKKINKSHLEFKIWFEPEIKTLTILTDPIKLKQILINLINNAFKFTNKGSIYVRCTLSGKILQFSISDTGIGIEKAKHSDIFKRFIQANTKISDKYGGTGLGLPIVKGLLNLLGGNIELNSEPGKGSTFSFTIPVESPTQNNFTSNLGVKSPGPCSITANVLIVEDDYYNSEYIRETLTKCTNITLSSVKTASEAIEIVQNQKIDAILMDIRLPDMSGYEATEIIKNIQPKIKIIAQTAYATALDKEKALKAGCDDYISKPITGELLKAKLSYLLNNYDS